MGKCGNAGRLIAVLAGSILASQVHAGTCRDDQVHLRGDWGQARFSVEVADTARERNQGLMHRDSMGQSAGMLFVYSRPRSVSFWMRNTLIPLDMLFLDAGGRVAKIHPMAKPLDEAQIHGGADIQYVLEINGGLAARLGITEGSALRHPAIDQTQAIWPCQG